MTSDQWLQHGLVSRKTGLYLPEDWMELFAGDFSFVLVLWVYCFKGSAEEFSSFDVAKIRGFLFRALSEKTIRVRRRQLIALGILETNGGSGRGREGAPCRVHAGTMKRLLANLDAGKNWIAQELSLAAAIRKKRRIEKGIQQRLFESGKKAGWTNQTSNGQASGNTAELNSPPESRHPVETPAPYIGVKDSNEAKQLASSPQDLLTETLRETIRDLEFSGLPANEQTVQNLAKEIGGLPAAERPLACAELRDRCERYYRLRRQRQIGWGIVVNDTKEALRKGVHRQYAAIAEVNPVEPPEPRPAPAPPPVPAIQERLAATPAQIAAEPPVRELQLCSLGELQAEAKLDAERAGRGPDYQEAVFRRWELPVLRLPRFQNEPLSAPWTQDWFFAHLTADFDVVPRKPPGREDELPASVQSAHA